MVEVVGEVFDLVDPPLKVRNNFFKSTNYAFEDDDNFFKCNQLLGARKKKLALQRKGGRGGVMTPIHKEMH